MLRRMTRSLRAAAVFASTLLLTAAVDAQRVVSRPGRLPSPGQSVASADDSNAVALNPANVAFVPAAELRWTGLFLDDTLLVPHQGHAFGAALPLPFSLATGLRVDAVSPPVAAATPSTPFAAGNYQWITWALAAGSEAAAVGFSIQRTYSDAPFADQLGSYSLGFSTRPANGVGFSAVAHDVNGPRNSAGGRLSASYDLALAIRPLGSSALDVGLEGKYVEDPDIWIPRATLGLDVAPVGRLYADFAMAEPQSEQRRSWTASGGLAVRFNGPTGSVEAGGGVLTGNGLGASGSYNPYLGVAFRNWRDHVGPQGFRYAVRIRVEATPSIRGHVALLRQLWSIAKEETVDGVVLELRTSPAESLAHVQELRDALHLLRQSGKRVLCHLEDATGSALYLCSAANRILLNPAGGLRFAGLKTRHLYFAALLEKLGVRADFVRIGAHKSAPEQFTREGASDVARADKIDLLQQHERQLVEGISAGRRLTVDATRKAIATGPFVAHEARAAGFVDGYAFDDQVEDALQSLLGRKVPLLEDERAPLAREGFGRQRRIAIVYVDGDMVDGRSQNIPFLGMKIAGSYTIAEALKQAREDPGVGAVVLRVETPGGSAMAADVIWRQVQLTAKEKPLVVSMGGYAASGGYYVSAAPGAHVFANPLTITGSIGIFYGKADVAELLGKIGVNVEVYKTAPRADAESLFRPFTADERAELQRKVRQFYDVFIGRVALGRGMTTAGVDAVGQGRVWTGEQAKARKLVDELGGLRQAIALAAERAGIPADAPITELPPSGTTILGRILGIEGIHADDSIAIPPQLVQMARSLAPFLVHSGEKPIARLEETFTTP